MDIVPFTRYACSSLKSLVGWSCICGQQQAVESALSEASTELSRCQTFYWCSVREGHSRDTKQSDFALAVASTQPDASDIVCASIIYSSISFENNYIHLEVKERSNITPTYRNDADETNIPPPPELLNSP